MKKRLSIILTLLIFGLSFTETMARATENQTSVATIVQNSAPSAMTGILFVDSKTHKTIYAQNAERYFAPASVTKLFTAAAALFELGENFRFQTQVFKKNNDIYIKFVGDPSLTTTDLEHMIRDLKKHGNQSISGNLIIDGTQFADPQYPPGLTYEDFGWYYAAPVSAIIINDNSVTYELNSNVSMNSKPVLKNKNNDSLVQLINNLHVVDGQYAKNHCSMQLDLKSDNTITLYGCVPQQADPSTKKFAIPNPALAAKNALNSALKKHTIRFDGKILDGKVPEDATLISTHFSEPLPSILSTLLKESDNTYANSLAKTLGHRITGQGTFTQAIFALKHILGTHTTLKPDDLDLSDGAGNRMNLITPRQIVSLLETIAANKKAYSVFKEALPQSGVSGNLSYRIPHKSLKGKVIAKTGTMHDIVTLAGYFYPKNKNQDPIIFVMMTNQVTGDVNKVRKMQIKILKRIMTKSTS